MKTPLDLSKFRKVKSDKNTSTFQHHDGHTITIAHNKLSSKMKSDLNKMPIASVNNKTKMFADGGPTSSYQSDSSDDITPAINSISNAATSVLGTDAQNQQNYQDSVASMPTTPQDLPQSEAQVPAPDAPMTADQRNAKALELSTQAAQQAQAQQDSEKDTGAPEESGQPQQNAAAPAAPASSAPINPQQQAANVKQNSINALTQDQHKLANELQTGQIKPETYHDLFVKNGTLGTIGNIFALLMGGAGAGLTHTDNPVTAMWDKTIQNDLDAQVRNQSNKTTLYGLAQQGAVDKANIAHMQLTDQQSKYNFARIQANVIAMHHLVQQVNTLDPNSPEGMKARQNLALMGQYVDMSNANLTDQIASKKAFQESMMNGVNGSNPAGSLRSLQLMGRITPEQYAQGNKEIASAQEAEKLRGDLIGSYNDLSNKFLAGKFSPEDRNSALNSFAGRLAKISEGRFNMEESKQQINAIMPTGFESAETRANKLTRLNQLIDGQVNTPTLNGLGIGVAKNIPQQMQANSMEGKTASDGRGNRVVMRGGKWTPLNSRVASGQ